MLRRATLAQLQALTGIAEHTTGEVHSDGANNGSYRFATGAWTRFSTATIPSLDTRLQPIEGAHVVVVGAGTVWRLKAASGQVLADFRAGQGFRFAQALAVPVLSADTLNLAGTATVAEIAAQRATLGNVQSRATADGLNVWKLVTPSGQIMARLGRDGRFRVARVVANQIDVATLSVSSALSFAGGSIAAPAFRAGTVDIVGEAAGTSLVKTRLPDGRIIMRLKRDGTLEVPKLLVTGDVEVRGALTAPALTPPDVIVPPPITVPQAVCNIINAAKPNVGSAGVAGNLSPNASIYGVRYGHLSPGLAITGTRIWYAFYGQNSFPLEQTGETDNAFTIIGYTDDFVTFREVLYVAPQTTDGMCYDPILATTPDGRLLCMYKNRTGAAPPNNYAFIIQNPEATAGAFNIGRQCYFGVGRPERCERVGPTLYMAQDDRNGIFLGSISFSAPDQVTWTQISQLPTEGVQTETSIAALSAGRFRAWWRTGSEGLATSISTPGGASWSARSLWTDWPNPAAPGTPAGTRAVFGRSPSGRLVGIINNHPTQRRQLTVILSEDDGVTWPYSALLDSAGETGPRVAYPMHSFDDQGRIVVIYDVRTTNPQEIRMVRFLEEEVRAGGTVSIERAVVATAQIP